MSLTNKGSRVCNTSTIAVPCTQGFETQYSTGSQKSRERSGTRYCRRAFRGVWYDARRCSWSAPKCLPSNPDPSDPNEEAPKTRALQSAPRFLGLFGCTGTGKTSVREALQTLRKIRTKSLAYCAEQQL
ncbi:hypothetical protein AG1IA_09806 [Rhizoctonia solani AG-1 IA]|uniref:Uncharacterized protein n=1 Tax=Thanatephorus cucumeris (strain AG1-IA) TaxID=983506 RepID=L8WII5_THACA|nr:hypothetical protein AG1IA_09806 [Rhizoctonia solani AG-1 IA]